MSGADSRRSSGVGAETVPSRPCVARSDLREMARWRSRRLELLRGGAQTCTVSPLHSVFRVDERAEQYILRLSHATKAIGIRVGIADVSRKAVASGCQFLKIPQKSGLQRFATTSTLQETGRLRRKLLSTWRGSGPSLITSVYIARLSSVRLPSAEIATGPHSCSQLGP
jgi:hypothetical protein